MSGDTAAFSEALQEWRDNKNCAPLIDIDVAMWPDDLSFAHDISDRERFNERFIESRFGLQDTVEKAYLASFWHSFGFLLCAMIFPFHPEMWAALIFMEICVAIPLALLLYALAQPAGRVRFNRQAQLVHGHSMRGEPVTVAWRDVQPFVKIIQLGNTSLRLVFPTPRGMRLWKKAAIAIEGTFDWGDQYGIHDCADRFEFIRRYMEQGLGSIAPGPGEKREKFAAASNRNWLFYYTGFGWLIDRWAARCQARFRWPDEVEKLCAEGADLSGYDTTPVTTPKNVFYRYDVRDGAFYICDSHGNRFTGVTH